MQEVVVMGLAVLGASEGQEGEFDRTKEVIRIDSVQGTDLLQIIDALFYVKLGFRVHWPCDYSRQL